MKNLNVKKKIFKIICYICQEKEHYTSNSIQSSKKARIKIDVNVVKKKVFEKKNAQIFKNSKRIKNESNLVYKITITNNDENNY